ncbi:MAG: ABC transporter permease [Halococcoides sp.]
MTDGPRAALRRLGSRTRAICGLAGAQLRYDRTRTLLAVVGIVVAVLATTILASLGLGVVATGDQMFEQADRDLWVTAGATKITPGAIGGLETPLVDAHALAEDLDRRPDVQTAVPMSFQTVYIGSDPDDLETVIGVGAPASGPSVEITRGEGFQTDDLHYAEGSYDGPMSRAVVLDNRTAARQNVSVGETVHVGGTVADARDREFTVVGISPTYRTFLGGSTAIFHLSELQELTGSARTDGASFITVALVDGADPEAVAAEIEAERPDLTVRTNSEQLGSILEEQALVLASGVVMIVLAVVAGVTLTTNLMLGHVDRQRYELAALRALGTSTATLVGVVTVEAVVLGLAGGLIGIGLTIPVAAGLEWLVTALVGFEGLLAPDGRVLAGGLAVAVVTSTVAGIAAGTRIARIAPLKTLER